MPRRRTTKTSVRKRRSRNQKTERLIATLSTWTRRFGVLAGVIIISMWLAAWLFLSGAAERSMVWGEQKLYEFAGSAGFSVKDVLVEGRINSDPDVLRALINIDRGDPIFAFDPTDAKEMIERISWVKQAHIERRLPGTIYIGLVERVPVALWQNKKKIRVIDIQGVTLTDRDIEPFKDLIILVGEQAPDKAPALLSVLDIEPELKQRVEAASWIGERRWDLKLKNGMTVKLPEDDLELAISRLVKAQKDDSLLDKDLSVIDMRALDRIIVRTPPGAVQEYKAGIKGNAI